MRIQEIKELKEEMKTERALLDTAVKELRDVQNLVNTMRQRKELLLIEDLSEDLIRKLQEMTDDNIIVLFCRDGTRIEIKRDQVSYKRKGAIR